MKKDTHALFPVRDHTAEAVKEAMRATLLRRRGRPTLTREQRTHEREEAQREHLNGAEQLCVLVPRELKLRLKLAAATQGKTLRHLVVRALRHYVNRHIGD